MGKEIIADAAVHVAERELARIMGRRKPPPVKSAVQVPKANRQGGPPPYKVPAYSPVITSSDVRQSSHRSSTSHPRGEGIHTIKRHNVAEGFPMTAIVDVNARIVDPHGHKKGWFANLGIFPTIICFALILAAFGFLAGYLNNFITSMNADAQMKQLLILERMKQIENMPRQSPTVQASLVATRQNVIVPMSTCDTQESQQQVIAGGNVKNTGQGGASYEFAHGCGWVQFDRYTTSLSGSQQFVFSRKDTSSPTGYKGCGTIGGLNDSVQKCIGFLNDNRNEPLLLTVLSGSLIVNN